MQNNLEDIVPFIDYFVERKCTPEWHIDEGRITFNDLTYVVSGKAVYIIDGTEYPIEEGDLLYVPFGCLRQAYTVKQCPMCCCAFNFHAKTLDGCSIAIPFEKVTHIGTDTELVNMCREFGRVWLEKEDGFMLKARALFMLILYRLFGYIDGRHLKEDRRIELVKKYIFEHYFQTIDMETLGEITGLNPVYLGAYFKKATGSTIKRYINTLRVNKAKDLLQTGGYSVGEAAYKSGFNDIYYFSKVFKENTGICPSKLI